MLPSGGEKSHDFSVMIDTFANLDECLLTRPQSILPGAPNGMGFGSGFPQGLMPMPTFHPQPGQQLPQPPASQMGKQTQAKPTARKRAATEKRGKLQVKDQVCDEQKSLFMSVEF